MDQIVSEPLLGHTCPSKIVYLPFQKQCSRKIADQFYSNNKICNPFSAPIKVQIEDIQRSFISSIKQNLRQL